MVNGFLDNFVAVSLLKKIESLETVKLCVAVLY